MIINSFYKFIFVHVPKTGGTSLGQVLGDLKGNETSLIAKTKHETLVNFEQRVYESDSSRGIVVNCFDRYLSDYYRFAFVRNPWDRMSSFYRYLVEKKPRHEIESVKSFKDFLNQAEERVAWIRDLHSMKPQIDYFTLGKGELKIDFVGHFEHLIEDVAFISERLNCPIVLPHLNQSTNSRVDYRKEYEPDMVSKVERLFHDDIRHFGYVFDDPHPLNRVSGVIDCPRSRY